MRIAVVGGGLGGSLSAYILAKKRNAEVVLYEKHEDLGGRINNFNVDNANDVIFELGSSLFINLATYTELIELLEHLGAEIVSVNASFCISEKINGYEWGNRNGLLSLFAQKKNAVTPYFWKMLQEILKFKHDVLRYLEKLENNEENCYSDTLGDFINSHGYSERLRNAFIVPICASLWSSHSVMNFSAYLVLSFFLNHHLLELFGCPQRLTMNGSFSNFMDKVRVELERIDCQIRCGCKVDSILTDEDGCIIRSEDGSEERYDECFVAINAPDALKLLGQQATYDELRILGAFQYVNSNFFLHRDKKLMPKNSATWSALNFLGTVDNKSHLTYWLNVIQSMEEEMEPYFITINPSHNPEHILLKWSTKHVIPSISALKASLEFDNIQGKRHIWFSGAYTSYGVDDNRLKAVVVAARGMFEKSCEKLNRPKQTVLSWVESGARFFVTRFLQSSIKCGCLILLEEGGSVYTFKGTEKSSQIVFLEVHSPQFYWKIFVEAELGFADAYINGDISFLDKNEGLLNFFKMVIESGKSKAVRSNFDNKWKLSLLLTAGVTSSKYCFKHALRKNSVKQARKNISQHYDLSNELFALFLGETMTYSCAVFKSEDEELKVAQLRKLHILIEKARIDKEHEVLDIGCGWGSLAIEVVRLTGCKYTGITLSKEQYKYAQNKINEAGLQDHAKFRLCDYRELPPTCKFDRIISIGMIEAVGDEYMEKFFGCCESLLAEDGLFVLQFISMPDELYDSYLRGPGFIKEYIFPGGCTPSFGRIISAMAAASRLSVEHAENIGIHYYQTLRCWRKNFMENKSEILALGFDEKFIRTWEYYFDYCAAGFKTRALADYQVVFSRLGNNAAFNDPYKGISSAYDCNF